MTLEQLRVLDTIVQCGGFRPAAEQLHRSQSALSMALRNLEDQLGLQLFDRSGYRPVLTPQGHALHQQAQLVLQRADSLKNLAQQLANGAEPELKIAITALAYMPPILKQIQHVSLKTPHTKLTVLMENMNGTLERLEDGDVDMVITEQQPQAAHYTLHPIQKSQMVPVIGTNTSRATNTEILNKEDLEGWVQVVVRDTSRHTAPMSAGLLSGANHWVVNDFQMKKQIIEAGLGWGNMPIHLVEESLKEGKLLQLEGEDFHTIDLPIYVVRHHQHTMGPVAQLLWDGLKKAA
ncbi:LysR family transcriptional regulator [Magnetococcus sp. PR-3]|uniref:LysR family transcriptional regulator n=1 Tax=Magnetococcus sp. PR-3 TaxID=3120355 RepID=UPI002FCE0DCC